MSIEIIKYLGNLLLFILMINDVSGIKKFLMGFWLVCFFDIREKKEVGGKMDVRFKWVRIVSVFLGLGVIVFLKR